MKYKVWHIGKEKFIHEHMNVYVNPDGDVLEIDEGTYGHLYKNVITDGVKVVRYTGLKDRNGTDVYEGDILQDDQGIGEVEWVQEHCAFLIFTRNPSLYHKMESDGKLKNSQVIGTIWENADLLPQAIAATE